MNGSKDCATPIGIWKTSGGRWQAACKPVGEHTLQPLGIVMQRRRWNRPAIMIRLINWQAAVRGRRSPPRLRVKARSN
jgi:hypothetical protein